jgi:hypothetical protein
LSKSRPRLALSCAESASRQPPQGE